MAYAQDLASTLDRVAALEDENRRLKNRIVELESTRTDGPGLPTVSPIQRAKRTALEVLGLGLLGVVLVAIFGLACVGADALWRALMAGMRE